jgi:hypothetical protein
LIITIRMPLHLQQWLSYWYGNALVDASAQERWIRKTVLKGYAAAESAIPTYQSGEHSIPGRCFA